MVDGRPLESVSNLQRQSRTASSDAPMRNDKCQHRPKSRLKVTMTATMRILKEVPHPRSVHLL